MQVKRLLLVVLAAALCALVGTVPVLAQCDEDQETDPIEDVAGVLDEESGTLYTTEDEEADVVAALEATQVPEGYAIERMIIDEETGKQEISTFHFIVVYVPWPGLFLPARPLCQCASPFVIVYRHRLCRTLLPGFASGCRPLPGGGSYSFVRNPLRRCVLFAPWRYCVERNRPWHVLTYYSDPFCQITTSVTTRCRFGC